MQGKPLKSHETDITKPLVVVFIVLVAILVANILGDFSNSKSSTSTRAAGMAVTTEQSNWCKLNKPLNSANTDNYDASQDYCVSTLSDCGVTSYDSTHAMDRTSSFLATSKSQSNNCANLDYRCCRRAISVLGTDALGDARCQSALGNPDALCLEGTTAKIRCGITYGSAAKSDIKCAKIKVEAWTNILREGTCCNPPLKTEVTDCGRSHINCTKTFGNNGSKIDSGDGTIVNMYPVTGAKNTDSFGNLLTVSCMIPVGEQDAVCAYSLNNSSDKTRCDGMQFAYPVSGKNLSNGCYATKVGSPSNRAGSTETFCRLYPYTLAAGETCRSKMGL